MFSNTPGSLGGLVFALVSSLDVVAEFLVVMFIVSICGLCIVFLLFFGRLVRRPGVRRGGDVRCVWVHQWNVRDLVCYHIMVWHRWVCFLVCAKLGCWS